MKTRKTRILIAVLLLTLLLAGLVPAPAQAAPSEQTRVAYASGALYTAPYGRGSYRGWVYGSRVIQFGTNGWYLAVAGWVQGTVTYRWEGRWDDHVQAGVSYWATYNQPPATWW